MLPDISKDGLEDNDELSNNFFMYIFKVQPCPKRGAHDWSSCPYAHPKEKARRRDPRVYKYASTPCPESLKGASCGRGVDCPYAHSVYEYWLHPSRFRTQMCKKGNQCNRTLCFFAHSASELRFPDTQDELEAAAVDAAAAQATATPLPLCTAGSSIDNSQQYALNSCRSGMPSAAGGSSFGLQSGTNISQVCSDSGRFGLLNAAAAPMMQRQHMLLQQEQLRPTYIGSDLAVQVPATALQQSDNQSISDPLPRLGSDAGAMAANNPAAWLQMAAAAQLTGSQIMSHISRPSGQQLVQQPAALLSGAAQHLEAVYAVANGLNPSIQDLHLRSAQQNMLMMSNHSDHSNSANMLTAGLANLALVDDNSAGSSSMTSLSTEQYMAVLNACNGGRTADMNMLQHTVNCSTASDNALLLQQLQQPPQQQQELLSLGSAAPGMSRQPSSSVFLGMSAPLANGSWVRMP